MRWAIGWWLFVSITLAEAADSPAIETPSMTYLPSARTRPCNQGVNAQSIDWPSVLDLANASSLDIDFAREKVVEACEAMQLAKKQWVPSLKVGVTWLHHDGRVQDIPGQVFDASKSSLDAGAFFQLTLDPIERATEVLKAKQQWVANSGELDRVTRQALHDVSVGYINVVAAQAGAAISLEINDLIDELVDRSKKLLAQGIGTKGDVLRNQAVLQGQMQKTKMSMQAQMSAGADLVRQLHLPPGTRLCAADEYLLPVMLVDEQTPEEELISLAQSQGPGLQEVVSLLEALENQRCTMQRLALAPTVQLNMGQSSFGGGFGGNLQNFNGASNYGVNVYWDVMRVIGVRDRQQIFEAKRRQACIKQQQVLEKLAAGVVVARSESNSARQRITDAENEVKYALQSYRYSKDRLVAAETASVEVLQAIGSLASARANYLQAVIDYNRAQIQLHFLLGTGNARACGLPTLRADEADPIQAPPAAPSIPDAGDHNKSRKDTHFRMPNFRRS